MLTTITVLWALLMGVALIMLGNGLQGTLLGLRASLEGFPTVTIGVVMAAYYGGYLVGSRWASGIVSRVGHIRVFAALAALASAVVLLHHMFVSPWLWFPFRLLSGFCFAGLLVVAESWLNQTSTNDNRGRVLSVYMVIQLGALGLGQLLLNLADPEEADLFILISILVSIAVVPILLTMAPTPPIQSPQVVGVRKLYTITPLGVLATLGVGVSHGGFLSMGAVYGEKAGLGAGGISLFMMALIFGGMLLQWPLGRMSDLLDRRKLILGVTLLAAGLALVAIPLSQVSMVSLLIVAGLFGGMALPLYALIVAYTNDFLERDQMVAASSSLVMALGFGAIMGPLFHGFLMKFLGAAGFFVALAVVHLLIGGLVFIYLKRSPAPPMYERPAASLLSPRATGYATALQAEHVLGETQAHFSKLYAMNGGEAENAGDDPTPPAASAGKE